MSAPARAKLLRCPAAAAAGGSKKLSPPATTASIIYTQPPLPPAPASPPPTPSFSRSTTIPNQRRHFSSSPSSDKPLQQSTTTFQPPPSSPYSSSSFFSSSSSSLTTTVTTSPLPIYTFSSSAPSPTPSSNPDQDPEQLRKVKLGTTLRVLQTHLPRILQTPLPSEILSPHITLFLFPSTHPHLPTVSGRVAYMAALWSSPIAWNRVPLVGNVRLEILSERMIKQPTFNARRKGAVGEQLVVRWRTVGKESGGLGGVKRLWFGENGGTAAAADGGGGGGGGKRAPIDNETSRPAGWATACGKEFTGLFIFDFDGEGRILSHTIEHVQEGGQWEGGLGAKVVGLTDWLLGGIRGEGSGGNSPCPAFERVRDAGLWGWKGGRRS